MNSRAMVLVFSAATVAAAATSAALQNADSARPAVPIIKVGLDLIQIDAAITDKLGQPVRDLKPEDFKLTVDGKPAAVTNAAFFGMTVEGNRQAAQPSAANMTGGPRSLIFLVDDLNMSFGSAYLARRALAGFAKEWNSQEALVAIRSVSDEAGPLTLSRKRERFEAAVSAVRYNILSNKGAASAPIYSGLDDMTSGSNGGIAFSSSINPAMARGNFEKRVFSLLSTVNALRSVPGRKAVVFISEGFDLTNDDRGLARLGIDSPFDSLFGDESVGNALRSIVEVANRASVVVYTLDPSGLTSDAPGADVSGMPSASERSSASLSRFSAQGTLRELADGTGGLSVYNRNDLKGGLKEVVLDQRAYYLVGFEPPEAAFARKGAKAKFHKIKLSVTRPGLRVRTREGFYGVTDEELVVRAPLVATNVDGQP